jgi:protein-S-isoprenylcysteine O-methyltransferase Ste14
MVAYSQIILGAWIVFMVFLYAPSLINRAPTDRRSSKYLARSLMVFLLAVILLVALEQFEPGVLFLRIIPDTATAGMSGVVLTIAGLGFSAYARIHLGRFWSSMVMIKVGHQLIRTGPYRFVRNPMYTGMLVALIGAAVAIGVLYAFAGLGILVVGIWIKIVSEEEILLETFGDEYLQYKKNVKAALIPFVV